MFRKRVHHREIEFVMLVFSEQRVDSDVRQNVVHPPHIPLIIKPEPAVFHGACDVRIRRGFLRNHNRVRIGVVNRVVEFFDESDRFEVFIVAVLIRKPLARFFIVIEIKHGSYGVHSQSVDMIFIEEKYRV